MKIIGVGIFSWGLLYILGVPFFSIISWKVQNYFEMFWLFHSLIIVFFQSLSEVVYGLFFFIQCCWKRKNTDISSSTVSTFTRTEFRGIRTWYHYFLLFLKGIIDAILYVIIFYSSLYAGYLGYLCSFVLGIAVTSVFCYIFLSYKYYLHHYLFYLVTAIGFVMIIINIWLEGQYTNKWYILVIIIGYCVQISIDVYGKWLMDNREFSPYLLLLIEGLGSTLMTLLLIWIGENVICQGVWNEFDYLCIEGYPLETFDTFRMLFIDKSWLYFLLWMIFLGASNVCVKFITFHFTPAHRAIADIITSFIQWIYITFSSEELFSTRFIILSSLGSVIIFIGIIFYNEVLILYVCGLGYYTRKEIIIRGQDEDASNTTNSSVNLDGDIQLGLIAPNY